jgi:hypothetical protein
MLNLTFTVSDLSTVMQIYDRIQIRRYTGTGIPSTPIDIADYTTIASGTDTISSRNGVSDVLLVAGYSQYYFTDPDGEADNWYISRYYDGNTGSASGWADPILGEPHDLYYNPLYPKEIEFGSADQLVIDRIRLLIGDPIGLRREYGEDAASSIHPDGKTYEMDEKGWAASINMNNVQYVSTSNPSVNGYRFLRFTEDISVTTWSGCVEYGVDLWYYTFLYSDREIMYAYDNCPPPVGLTTINANAETYMLKTAYELLYQQISNDALEDGAVITDEGSRYDPSPGLSNRKALLDDLKKRLDKLVKSLLLTSITGVLID